MPRTVAPVPEEVVRLRVNGELIRTWSCSPAALEALAAGRLLSLGFLRSAADLVALRVGRDATGHLLDATITEAAMADGRADEAHREVHGCGLRFLLDCRPDRIASRGGAVAPPRPEAFPDLFRALFERSPTRKDTGGHHTAALCTAGELVALHEEVGRHNAVDKVLGDALLRGLDPNGHGLLVTARISGEIMEKAARAGVAWVASRSVPTGLAVEIASAAGVPVIARAASPDARRLGPGAEGA